ncbi:MAG: nitrogen fixation protein NifZ [Azonexaceae bacterium]|uniref:nitrogen fixation protein NifZ n=1 Tax=Azonexus sp. R2A61 TaxID=2744443 RepID=UPI001F162435|nr:nitrogen fixation protein NifZ [Azonexus sp. R2A61]MCE1240174.1 nitrogen fixation protein NifZ [Azonexaceae bacterium]
MSTVQYEIGDMVYAAEDILNDGTMPGIDEEEGLIVAAGARGVVVQFGHSEFDPSKEIYLVRFESEPGGDLGNPVGVLPDELTQEPAAVDA